MKAKDISGRETQDLNELCAQLKKDLFSYRMKNFTGQLDDTSLIQKTRRDVARISTILKQRLAGRTPAVAPKGGAPKDGSES